MASRRNRRVLLVRRPVGVPQDGDFRLDEVEVPELGEGQALVRNLYLMLDPAIRGWMNESKGSYMPPIALGSPVRSGNLSQVIESRIPGIEPGQLHSTLAGWEEYSVLDTHGFHGRMQPEPGIPLHSLPNVFGGSGLTAYFGLFEIGRPKEGETVVVSAASGSVGSLVGQLAKIAGARAVGLTSDAAKAKWLVEELGFDAAIDYRHEDLREALKRTCPKGVDVYFDSVGGEILDTVLGRINVGARVVLCGAISQINATEAPVGPRNYMQLLAKRACMQGFVTIDFAKRYPEARQRIAAFIREGKLRYRDEVIDGLDNAPRHFLRLFDGSHRGKLMVRLADPEGSST
ncbi:MAG: NADP-dependent oxidoreductase [Polyangiales bacterium]